MKRLLAITTLALTADACSDSARSDASQADTAADADISRSDGGDEPARSDASASTGSGGGSPTRRDASASPVDGSAPDSDGSVPSREGDAGGTAAPSDTIVCSSSPLDLVALECNLDGAPCATTPVADNDCPLGWGCASYSTAVLIAAQACLEPAYYRISTARGCGYTVIEARLGPGAPERAFYAPDGSLVGTWSMSDVLSQPARCSGEIPTGCIDWEGNNLTMANNLCLPGDSGLGATPDAG